MTKLMHNRIAICAALPPELVNLHRNYDPMNLLDNPVELKHIISLSSFRVQEGRYVYARVASVLQGPKHLMIIDDEQEITVVTKEDNLPAIDAIEINKDRWRLINIKCGNPFYCIGFIAIITRALAMEGIDVVLTSSYSRDLVMVIEKDLQQSVEVLKREGFAQE